MSEVKVGDRVRVVIEDVVTGVYERMGTIGLDATVDIKVGEFGVVSIEVITPPFVLPTKMWAQVALGEGTLFTRVPNDMWRDLDGAAYFDSEMYDTPGLRVISEGVDGE